MKRVRFAAWLARRGPGRGTFAARRLRGAGRLAGGLALVALLGGCAKEMREQPYVEPLERSNVFSDGMGSRPEVQGTVSREQGQYPLVVLNGRENGVLVERIPIEIDGAALERGQERYEIYCVPCHGTYGQGDGLVTERGYPAPPDFGQLRLRTASDGHLFDVISNGFGIMYSYGNRIDPMDRWAIVAYVRALQRAEQLASGEQEGRP